MDDTGKEIVQKASKNGKSVGSFLRVFVKFGVIIYNTSGYVLYTWTSGPADEKDQPEGPLNGHNV